MHSVSRSIEAAALVVALFFVGLGAVAYAPAARADGTIPSGCVIDPGNGSINCSDGDHGSVPPSCQMVQGVIVCGDDTLGDKGSICVTVKDSTQQSCLTGLGTPAGAKGRALGRGLGNLLGLPQQTTGTGWLSRLTGWIAYAISAFFTALVGFLKDMVTYVVAALLGLVAIIVQAIPVPDWIANNSMGSLLGQTGPVAGFFMAKLQIPAGLALIGAGYAFRLLRKFLTLFQW